MKSSNLLLLFLSLFSFSLQAQQKIYWTNNSIGIMSANIDGTNSKVLIKNRIFKLTSIDVDTVNNKVYWTDGFKKHIGRSNIDGSNSEILIEWVTTVPSNIRVDNVNNKIYWLEIATKTLNRANLDGTSREVVASNLPAGYGTFELDIRNAKFYWIDGINNKIIRTNLDNTVKTDIVVGLPEAYIVNLKLDLINKRVYWGVWEVTDSAKTRIKSRTLEGLDEKTIFTKKYSNGVFIFWEFEINPVTNRLYIRDINETFTVGSNSYTPGGFLIGKLDGTNLTQLFGWSSTFRYGKFRADLKNNKLYAIGESPYGIYSFFITDTQMTQQYITKETIISPSGIAVDKTAGKIYWTDIMGSKIQRANLDGSSVEEITSFRLLRPIDLALDLVNKQIYWTDLGTNDIKKANLDGTNVQIIINSADISAFPECIALDVPNKKIYYTTQGSIGIYRANFDGTNREILIRFFNQRAIGDQFALDLENKKIYWSEAGDVNAIMRANLDGSQRDTFFRKPYTSDGGISIDVTNKKIYWMVDSLLQRVNFDGTNPINLINNLPVLQSRPGGYMTWGASHSYVAGEITSNKVSDLEQLTGVTVFPTVFDKSIHVEIKDANNAPIHYTIYDLSGRMITNGSLNTTQTINGLGNLEKGMYILELTTQNKYFSTKLIKNN
jgi:hypothetical protein